MKEMWKEFKEFAVKGSAVDLAVGVIIGAAFGSIVNSLVKDVLMPPISLLTGGLDFSSKFVVFRAVNKMRQPPVAKEKDFPACAMKIPIKAARCPHCTSELRQAASQ